MFEPKMTIELVFFSRSMNTIKINKNHETLALLDTRDEGASDGTEGSVPATLRLMLTYSLSEKHLMLDSKTKEFKSQSP